MTEAEMMAAIAMLLFVALVWILCKYAAARVMVEQLRRSCARKNERIARLTDRLLELEQRRPTAPVYPMPRQPFETK